MGFFLYSLMKLPVARKLAVGHMCLTVSFLATGGFKMNFRVNPVCCSNAPNIGFLMMWLDCLLSDARVCTGLKST